MEQIDQPIGGHEVITSQDTQSSAPSQDLETEGGPYRPPLTFEEAQSHNGYRLLMELHDHAVMGIGGHSEDSPEHHLTELALSAAAIHRWGSWQPLSMHRAFAAGANLAEVAAAAGTTEADVYRRWATWAGIQSQLRVGERPCLDPEVVAAVSRRLNPRTRLTP
jgi:hypothetical protein